MPILSISPDAAPPVTKLASSSRFSDSSGLSAGLPADVQEQLTRSLFNQANGTNLGVSTPEVVARWAAGTTVDLVDSLVSSRFIPGTERGDVWSLLDGTEEKDFYERNKGLIEGSSAIAGLVGTAVATNMFVIPRVASYLADSSFLTSTRLWQLGSRINATTRSNMLSAMESAAKGGANYSQWNLRFGTAGLKFSALEALKGIGVAAGEEAVMYGLMNANDAAYSSDWSSNAFWATAGLAFGAGAGIIGARADIRKFANSPLIRDIRANNIDTTKAISTLTEPVFQRAIAGEQGAWRAKESALFTDYMIGARAEAPAGAEAGVVSQLQAGVAGMIEAADRSAQKMIAAGMDGIQVERGNVTSLPEWVHLRTAVAKEDPFILTGVDRIGIPKKGIKESLEDQTAYIEQLRKEADVWETRKGIPTKARELRALATTLEKQEHRLMIDGTWFDAKDVRAQQFARFRPGETLFTKTANTRGFSFRRDNGKTLTVDDSFVLPVKFEDMSVLDQMRTVEAMNRIQGQMLSAKVPFNVSAETVKKGNWLTLDAATQFAARGGKVNLAGSGLASMEDLRLASLQAKAAAVLTKFGSTTPITQWDRLAFNLPKQNTFERFDDVAGDTLREWLKGVMATKTSKRRPAAEALSQLEEALDNARMVQGFQLKPSKASTTRPSLTGNVFTWNRNAQGQWLRPMLASFDTENRMTQLVQKTLQEEVAKQKLYAVNELQKLPQTNYVRQLTDTILNSPEGEIASRIMGFSNDQITGTGGGFGQLASEVLTQRMRYRDNAAMLAAEHVRAFAQRHANAALSEMMEKSGLTADFTAINSVGREHQKVMLDQWFSNRQGWDLELEPVQVKGDKWAFELSDSINNRLRLGLDEAEEVPEGTLLRNGRNGNIIVLDDFTMAFKDKFNQVTKEILTVDNALRSAGGLKLIREMPHYVPSPNTDRAFIGFVFDETDKLVPGKTIVAKTEHEFDTLREKTLADLVEELGPSSGHRIYTKRELESWRPDLLDQAQMDWIDPSRTFRPGGSQTGGLAGAYVNPRATAEALDWVRRKIDSHVTDTLEILYKDTLTAAEVNSKALRATQRQSIAKGDEVRNIYDEYRNMILGKANAYQKGSITGAPLMRLEDSINRLFSKTPFAASARWAAELAERMGVPSSRIKHAKNYTDVVKALGDYSPYKSAVDYAEQQLGVKVPKDLRKVIQKTSWLSASLMLRWDVSHAAMNMLGIIATLPTLISGGRAPITVGFNLADGSRVGAVDTGKIFAQAFKDMVTKGKAADWNHMQRYGDAEQQVAEFYKALGAIESHHGWRKWAANIDKWLAFVSQNSENLSRQWAHFAGLRLADYHGITGMTARHDFAREIANAAIADYSPVNRPELFQTGLGSMYGQFMSYMLNQNMKLFRWMENREYGQFASALAMQASLFGALGVPGARQVASAYDWWNRDGGGEPTGIDRLYAQFGPVAGSAIANGGMDLFGLAFHTRGDLSIRTPSVDKASDLLTMAPSISILAKVASTITDTIGIVLAGHTATMGQQIMETVTREMPNRVARGWLTVLQGGQEIDPYGNVAAETRTWLDTAARLIGLRSARQQAELEQYYASRAEADKDAARFEAVRGRLRTAVRSALRSGDDIDLVGYFNDYVKAGGNPNNFRTWAKGIVREAGSARAVNALKKSMRSPSSHLEAWRFNAYGAGSQ